MLSVVGTVPDEDFPLISGEVHLDNVAPCLYGGLRLCPPGSQQEYALPWPAERLRATDYSWQLPAPKATYLNIDFAQMGVGGDNSWGARTHPEYTLPGGQPYKYRFTSKLKTLF